MASQRNLKEEILRLRQEKMSYRKIQSILNCSKNSVRYHCSKNDVSDIGMKKYPVPNELKKQISEFCKNNKISEASKHFNLSISTINRYKNYQE